MNRNFGRSVTLALVVAGSAAQSATPDDPRVSALMQRAEASLASGRPNLAALQLEAAHRLAPEVVEASSTSHRLTTLLDRQEELSRRGRAFAANRNVLGVERSIVELRALDAASPAAIELVLALRAALADWGGTVPRPPLSPKTITPVPLVDRSHP